MLLVAIFAAVDNEHQLCHQQCFGARIGVGTGRCKTGFCGSGLCCKLGLVAPPCDGKMGCKGFQCCVDVTETDSKAETAEFLRQYAPTPPPLPPLSECAIERIEYEIGEIRHDEVGDEEFEVVLHVEPWHPNSIVKLSYEYEGNIDNGAERVADVMHLTGAKVHSDLLQRTESGKQQQVRLVRVAVRVTTCVWRHAWPLMRPCARFRDSVRWTFPWVVAVACPLCQCIARSLRAVRCLSRAADCRVWLSSRVSCSH